MPNILADETSEQREARLQHIHDRLPAESEKPDFNICMTDYLIR